MWVNLSSGIENITVSKINLQLVFLSQICNSFLKFLFAGALFCVNLDAVMLVSEYKDQNLSNWVMSEKYDGVRGYWDGKKMLSKNGNQINAPKWFLDALPPFAIDGELWSGRGKFEKTVSITADSNPSDEWRDIKFMIFDVPNASGDLFQRLGVLERFLAKNPNKFINIIEQIYIKSNSHAFDFLDTITANGGEGIVVRDPKAAYSHTRSTKILKIKKFKDSECEITALREGKGRLKGLLGSVSCKDLRSGEIFKIGSGFSDEMRKNGLKIGQIITYKYQNLTPNKKPRFPVFLRVREDF